MARGGRVSATEYLEKAAAAMETCSAVLAANAALSLSLSLSIYLSLSLFFFSLSLSLSLSLSSLSSLSLSLFSLSRSRSLSLALSLSPLSSLSISLYLSISFAGLFGVPRCHEIRFWTYWCPLIEVTAIYIYIYTYIHTCIYVYIYMWYLQGLDSHNSLFYSVLRQPAMFEMAHHKPSKSLFFSVFTVASCKVPRK